MATKYLSLAGLTTYDAKIKAYIMGLNSSKVQLKPVSTLPTTGEDGIIYLVPNNGTGQNVKDEYVWINGAYELLGTTAVDLSGYYTKEEIVTVLSPYAKTEDVATKAQGMKADTAVQPAALTEALTPYAKTADVATAAQGAKADTALQPSDIEEVTTADINALFV